MQMSDEEPGQQLLHVVSSSGCTCLSGNHNAFCVGRFHFLMMDLAKISVMSCEWRTIFCSLICSVIFFLLGSGSVFFFGGGGCPHVVIAAGILMIFVLIWSVTLNWINIYVNTYYMLQTLNSLVAFPSNLKLHKLNSQKYICLTETC